MEPEFSPPQPSVQPISPAGVGEQQPELATPEDRQQLMDLVSKVRGKLSEVNTARFVSDNTTAEYRRGFLKEIFALLQKAGVDLEDRASVAEFLDRLRSQNPELASMVEEAIDRLLGVEEPSVTQGREDTYEALPQEVPEPLQGQPAPPSGV